MSASSTPRRTGDAIAIPGDYQHRALTEGPAVQRFWHFSKQLAITQLLPPGPGDFILDVGCGSGVIAGFLGESGAVVLGLDGSDEAIAYASRHFASSRVTFRRALVDETFAVSQPVDKIYCMELIEHIYPQQAETMLSIFHHLLRPGGCVFLTTPNYRSLWPIIEWGMDRFSGAAHLAEDQHVAKYHPARLRALAGQCGFRVRAERTMSFAAPWIAPLSWRAALALHRWETARQMPFGSICVMVLEKP